MVSIVSRTGRQLQRYNNGRRQVAGCIPYRLKMDKSSSNSGDQTFEVLVITSQKGHGALFPKGGWETDETLKQAARREALEEAGVRGEIKHSLGKWCFKSKRHIDTDYEGHMFSLLVRELLDLWPEMDVRHRRWMTVAEARESCQYWWMVKALDELESRLSSPRISRSLTEGEATACGLAKKRTSLICK